MPDDAKRYRCQDGTLLPPTTGVRRYGVVRVTPGSPALPDVGPDLCPMMVLESDYNALKARHDASLDALYRLTMGRQDRLDEVISLKAERDRLVALWPSNARRCVWQDHDGAWRQGNDPETAHPTREAAVRAVTGTEGGGS